jgi:osmotically-inducible protein OsmY
VPSYSQYLEAAAAARRVAGVRQVHNHLAVELSDADYRDDVAPATAANALLWDVAVPAGEATASNGNLTLTGIVSHGAEHTAAELAVGRLIGVPGIKDEIDISYDAADPGLRHRAGAGRARPQRAGPRRQRRRG